MTERGAERVFKGLAAAEGLVIGEIAHDAVARLGGRRVGNAAEECDALLEAVAQAKDELGALIAAQDELAAEILEFQQALLEDDDLLAPIFKAIQDGKTANGAWDEAMNAEIAEYRSGEDDYLSARADDLADLKLRVLQALSGSGRKCGVELAAGAILVAEDLTPSRFLELDWKTLGGAAIRGGSPTSHVAILARARGVPLMVGLEAEIDGLAGGTIAILDSAAGTLVLAPSAASLAEARTRRSAQALEAARAASGLSDAAATADGTPVRILINLDDPRILDDLSPETCDGIGLTRTEFLFQGDSLPDEAEQLRVYRKILAWAAGRPVTIRTLDAGGDKPIAGLSQEAEDNPFLGIRGLRLSLAHPEVFRVQLRALARAAAAGPLKVMVPMVTLPRELAQVRELLDQVLAELAAEGTAHTRPALGMMVEVPAAALMAADFEAEFYSIGSNDLVQYTLAAARDNPALAALAEPGNPAVLELIRRTVEAAAARKVEVSLCGDMASDSRAVGALLDSGLRTLSVAPAQVGHIKEAVRGHSLAGGEG